MVHKLSTHFLDSILIASLKSCDELFCTFWSMLLDSLLELAENTQQLVLV